MARANLTVQTASAAVPRAAVTMTAVDGTNGNQWSYTGRRVLMVTNDSASAVTVTINSNANVHGLTVPNRTVSVAAGATALIPEGSEARQDDGMVYVDWSAGTSVTAAVLELRQ